MKGVFELAPNLTPAEIRERARRVHIVVNEGTLGLDEAGRSRTFSENAVYGGSQTERFPLYHFIVMQGGGASFRLAQAPGGGDFVLSFRPNPQQIVLAEPAAVTVQPLQNGGRYVEHQGDAIGDLQITGTTGLFLPPTSAVSSPIADARSPGLLDAGVRSTNGPGARISPGLGRAWEHQEGPSAAAASPPPAGASGFDRIVEMRTFFRLYFDLRRSGAPVFLTWLNLKDGEWWIVESVSLRVPRAVDFRVGYRYEIGCKVLGRLDPAAPENPAYAVWVDTRLVGQAHLPAPSPALADRARSGLAVAAAAATDIRAAVQRVQSALGTIQALGGSVEDILSTVLSVEQAAAALITETPRAMLDLLFSIGDGVVAVADVPLRDLEALLRFTQVVARSFPGDLRLSSDPPGLEDSLRELPRVLMPAVLDRRRASRNPGSRTKARERLDDARSLDADLAAAPVPTGTAPGVVLEDETIRDLSLRLLGDETRWKEIVILNDLVPPYISAEGGPGVLRPGDVVLLPAPALSDGGLPDSTGTSADAAARYGTDLRLSDPTKSDAEGGRDIETVREVREGGERVFDFAIVEGLPNLIQALHVQATTEPGELPLHREYGFALPIGTRLDPLALFFHKFQAARSLLRDDRVEAVREVSIIASGAVARLRVTVAASGTKVLVSSRPSDG